MAKTLKSFDFKRMGNGRGGSYDQYLDGQIWELTLEDAPGTNNIQTMRTSMQGAARRKGLSTRTQIIRNYESDENGDLVDTGDEDAVLVFIAYDPENPPEQFQSDDE